MAAPAPSGGGLAGSGPKLSHPRAPASSSASSPPLGSRVCRHWGTGLRARVGGRHGQKIYHKSGRAGGLSSGYRASPGQVLGDSYFSQIRNNITSLRRRYGLKNPEEAWSPFVSKAACVAATSRAAFVRSQGEEEGGCLLAFPGMEGFGHRATSPLRPRATELW